MNQLDANNWLVFGTLVMAGATVISFIALIWNAYLFRKQIRTQHDQTNAMLDLRRKQILPQLNIWAATEVDITDTRYFTLNVTNKGETAKTIMVSILTEKGLIGLDPPSTIYRFFENGQVKAWQMKTTPTDFKIHLGIFFTDIDNNHYQTVLKFVPDETIAFTFIKDAEFVKV